LNEDQAKKRAGLTPDGHNHGEDWGSAGKNPRIPVGAIISSSSYLKNTAVEMGAKRKLWASGIIG
jgi:6,7-dimethyl-8-ribityllumazine synthase